MDEQKLNKFANNSLTDRREIEKVIDWIEASEVNQRKFNKIKNLQIYTDFLNFGDIHKKTVSLAPKRLRISSVTKYAAVLIIVFLAGGFLFHPLRNLIIGANANYNEIVVPLGESAEVILADQTHVWLNSGSKLKYPSEFNAGCRLVELSGEAFFDVTKNKRVPFIVATPELRVRVLGTNFNVEALSHSKTTDVTLVEGIVNIEKPDGEFISQLKPNQRAIFNRQLHTLKISQVDTRLYTSWKEGIIYFRDETLEEIASKLEQWFNLEIVFDDPSLKKIKYTGAILKNKPIDQLLEILSYTANVDSEIEIKSLKPNVVHIKKKPMK